jgi:hypothetical protein
VRLIRRMVKSADRKIVGRVNQFVAVHGNAGAIALKLLNALPKKRLSIMQPLRVIESTADVLHYSSGFGGGGKTRTVHRRRRGRALSPAPAGTDRNADTTRPLGPRSCPRTPV